MSFYIDCVNPEPVSQYTMFCFSSSSNTNASKAVQSKYSSLSIFKSRQSIVKFVSALVRDNCIEKHFHRKRAHISCRQVENELGM